MSTTPTLWAIVLQFLIEEEAWVHLIKKTLVGKFYLQKDEIDSIFSVGSNISDKKFDKIKDYELASCILKSKNDYLLDKYFYHLYFFLMDLCKGQTPYDQLMHKQ